MTQPLIPDLKDPIAIGIAKKRAELLALRRELEKQIKAIDKSIALLGQAVQVFDPATKVHLDAHGLKSKRFPHTKRFVLSILREAGKPMTPNEIMLAWMRDQQVSDTQGNRRVILGRVSSCLQNCKTQGLIVRAAEGGWRLTEQV